MMCSGVRDMCKLLAPHGWLATALQVLRSVQSVSFLFVLIPRCFHFSEFFDMQSHSFDSVCHPEMIERAFAQNKIDCSVAFRSSSVFPPVTTPVVPSVEQSAKSLTREYRFPSPLILELSTAVAVPLAYPCLIRQLRESVSTASVCC